MSIRPATEGDRAEILDLLARCGLPADGVSDHLHTALVALEDGRVVGCAALEVYEDGALLRSVAVDAAARGHRLGQELTRSALAISQRIGALTVYLLTTTAETFFRGFGFEKVTRADVPVGVRQSVEFQYACPASATVMRRRGDILAEGVGFEPTRSLRP